MKTGTVPSNRGSGPPTSGEGLKAFLQKYEEVESDLIASRGRKIKTKNPPKIQSGYVYIHFIYIFIYLDLNLSREEKRQYIQTDQLRRRQKNKTRRSFDVTEGNPQNTDEFLREENWETPRHDAPGCISQHAAGVRKDGEDGGRPGIKVSNHPGNVRYYTS